MTAGPSIGPLEEGERRQLLRRARRAAREALGAADSEEATEAGIDGRFGGAFVTLWAGKRLRGCVGSFASTDDIGPTVSEVTKLSLGDARFAAHPVTLDELCSINIEISILSAVERVDDPASLVPGVHGVLVRRGEKSGCFLPKVATERQWAAEEFLSNCCTMKAGLPADAWRSSDTEVLWFTAEVFSELRIGG